ncbi:hypothetical protein G3567_08415 [Psychroflexus sp. YR1-1]|uniref:Uncharacterized protein n=1 Tax=Psychroflexus aurantiacus TaxID=2709310 RepID=A0A6B3R0R2_9FLAO|nr:hypothetical protein [Psychroflexus aurantiacus]NEV94166.1 hypothetical protein [Psychroflexus aurantiacus]
MEYKNIFERPEFKKRLETVRDKIEIYLSEHGFQIEDVSLNELIQWNETKGGDSVQIYPHEKCPSEIKNIVQGFINDEFNSRNKIN